MPSYANLLVQKLKPSIKHSMQFEINESIYTVILDNKKTGSI